MSHGHHPTLARIFAHPTSHNIHWREVTQLFLELGGKVEETKKDHLKVHLVGKEMTFPVPHGRATLGDDHEISSIRRFLKDCGFGPSSSP